MNRLTLILWSIAVVMWPAVAMANPNTDSPAPGGLALLVAAAVPVAVYLASKKRDR